MKINKIFQLLLVNIFVLCVLFFVSCEMEPEMNPNTDPNSKIGEVRLGDHVFEAKIEMKSVNNYSLASKENVAQCMKTSAIVNKEFVVRTEYPDLYTINSDSRVQLFEKTSKGDKIIEDKFLKPDFTGILKRDAISGRPIQFDIDILIKELGKPMEIEDNYIFDTIYNESKIRTIYDGKGFFKYLEQEDPKGNKKYIEYTYQTIGKETIISKKSIVSIKNVTVKDFFGDNIAKELSSRFNYTESDFQHFSSLDDLKSHINGDIMAKQSNSYVLQKMPNPEFVSDPDNTVVIREKYIEEVTEVVTYKYEDDWKAFFAFK